MDHQRARRHWTAWCAGQSRVSVRPAFRAKYNDGHAISYRIAHFIKFHEEKVVKYVSIIDSFDAVEQMLGYNLDAHDGFRVEGDIVAV